MASEMLIFCGTIGMLASPNIFEGSMIILGVIGALLRFGSSKYH